MIHIIGAGIAGLTLANALEKLNINYHIYEQAPKPIEQGAGLVIQNNGYVLNFCCS